MSSSSTKSFREKVFVPVLTSRRKEPDGPVIQNTDIIVNSYLHTPIREMYIYYYILLSPPPESNLQPDSLYDHARVREDPTGSGNGNPLGMQSSLWEGKGPIRFGNIVRGEVLPEDELKCVHDTTAPTKDSNS